MLLKFSTIIVFLYKYEYIRTLSIQLKIIQRICPLYSESTGIFSGFRLDCLTGKRKGKRVNIKNVTRGVSRTVSKKT